MSSKNALVVFQAKRIRRVWHNDKWFFSVIDVVCALEASSIPKRYWSDLKSRLSDEGFEPYDKIVHLKMQAEDGKLRFTDCANTEDMFRIIQSIPSKKAEPFKRWLAHIGFERIEEIENPELGQDRIKKNYELKGYPKDWINKRLRGIAVRQELTEEWKNREIQEQKDFAILTNEITKATFNKNIKEYKDFKNLKKKNQNLRDHMTDWELILTMVGEKATTDITISKDSKGFEECKDSAIEGGTIAKNTRKELEQKIGKPLVSNDNYLDLNEKKIENKKKDLYKPAQHH